ncbi:PREDICTED: death-associated protein kinase related [Bactrocera latifrons]|uniref:death-associated protein kinase related n=1 Tax=Bactrocera latifrons TaxID=174628 RepID=UPI0008DD10B1|nr:PREDICTED: death-associated protein kinase related [Bactrocera latifrons]
MFTEGIFPIGDGLLDINEDRLKELLVADDINEIYELEQTPFARGKFAAVRRAIHKNSGTHFAAKFLKRRRRAQSSDKEIKHEIAVLMLCDGADNIVKLNAVHESRSDTALLLELATGGELQTFLDNEECLSEAHARYCMREVLKALQYLHKRSIAHLDLKPQNILLTGERIEDGLKLCDFGISRVVAEGTNVREIVGTPDYVAPEVLQYEPLSLLTDIWSVGVLAYVLLSGFSPFGGETKQETFLNISQCALTFPDKLFGGVSAAAIDFIRRALRIKPNDRMTAAGCLEHIWLKDECSIDRQILTDITKSTTVDSAAAAEDEDDDDEEDVDVDEDEDDDGDDEAEEEDNEVKANEAELENEMSHDNGDEDELNISIDTEQQLNGTNGSKMESSDVEELAEESATNKQALITNGKTAYNKSNSNGYSNYNGRSASNSNYSNNTARHNGTHITYANGAGSAARYANGVKASATTTAATTTQRTTAVVTVPAVRATTIPLQYNGGDYRQQQQQQHQLQRQQQLQVLARRHSSSDSNKENTFLATKKIAPSTANVGSVVKKPLTATATTTIVIAGSEMGDATTATGVATANVVATFTLPSGYNHNHSNHSNNSNSSINNSCLNSSNSNHSNNNANHEKYITTTTHCLFPDAPTTPKVIRKTPNTEASPTSVKALVKKFQLEGGNTSPTAFEKHATTHLKEAQATNQQTLHATTTQMNGVSAGSNSSSSKKSPITNGIAKKFDTTRKYGGEQHNGTAGSGSLSNGRRASEPATVTHVTTHIAHNRSGSGGIGIGSAAATSYKTTCVLCIGGGGSKAASSNGISSDGCRHSTDAAGRYNKTSSISNNNGTAATKCCSSKMSNSNANATNTANVTATAIVNGSSNGSTAATTTTALLLGSSHHQQQQQQQQQQLHQHHMNGVHHHPHHHHHHHHHHMHAATKAATANNLSLDQGIIC